MPKPKPKKRATRSATPANQATMVVTLYDGTRQPIQGKDFLIRIFDGFQNRLFDGYRAAPTTVFRLPAGTTSRTTAGFLHPVTAMQVRGSLP